MRHDGNQSIGGDQRLGQLVPPVASHLEFNRDTNPVAFLYEPFFDLLRKIEAVPRAPAERTGLSFQYSQALSQLCGCLFTGLKYQTPRTANYRIGWSA
jgi:hypothetical protein